MRCSPALTASGALIVVASAVATSFGATWVRSNDWTARPPSDIGTSIGNPDDDANGDPVWSYQYVENSGGVMEAQPWYNLEPTLMVWDGTWFGAAGRWVLLDDTLPSTGAANLVHAIRVDLDDLAPLVRWTNPRAGSIRLKVSGQLNVTWSGVGGMSSPVDVDLILARTRAGTNIVEPIVEETLSKPTNVVGPEESVNVPVPDFLGLVQPGEEFILSIRNQTGVAESQWIVLEDILVIQEICAGDANGDGIVNFADITSVLNNWLDDFGIDTGPGDSDANGVVNFADITSVLNNWLGECP